MKAAISLIAGLTLLTCAACSRQAASSASQSGGDRAALDSLSSEGQFAPIWSDETPALLATETVDVQTYPPLAKLHQEYEQEFIEAAGFGLSRIPRMSIQPQALFTLEDGRSWRVLQHNLLGIAEHDEPTVLSVSSPSAPRHRDPPGAPPAVKASRAAHMPLRTEREERPLNAFETLAVERMLAGEQGPWIAEAPEEGPHRSRLLGALRARSECLECHTAYQEGEPLGALVYLIEHVQPEMSPEAGNPLFGFAGTPR